MYRKLLLTAIFVFGLSIAFPHTTEATWMTCDTSVRQGFVSTRTGWDQEKVWDEVTAYAWSMSCVGNPSLCQWTSSPQLPFTVLSTGMSFMYPDMRPLNPPETAHPWSLFQYTITDWNSCAAFCSTVEDSEYCMGTLVGQCYAMKLKPGHSPSSITTKSITRQGGTFGAGYGTFSSLEPASSYQSGTCTPRPPTVNLTATPTTINQGGSATLTWDSFNVDSCTGVGFNTGGATSGSVPVSPSATTQYTINCTGGAGPASDTETVTVTGQVPNPPTNLSSQCSADGTSVTLSWGQSAGATGYYVRVDDPTNNAPTCTDGWFCSNPPDRANDNYAGTSITYQITPNRSYNWWVHAANASGISNPTNAGFNCPGNQATDLVPAGISPTTASRGVATTITATISNTGAAAPASNVYVRVPGGKTPIYQGYPALPAIPAGTSRQVTFLATFPSAGSYPVEICADWYGAVTESNEGNNCATYTVDVPETPISNSVSCDVTPRTLTTGGSATYTAYPVGAATSPYTWTATDGVGGFGSGQTITRTFSAAGSYGMQVSATYAATPANCPVVTVTGGFCTGTPELTITATPSRVRVGQTSAIAWSATGVPGASASCTVSGPGVSWSSAVTASPQCSATGSANPTIITQSTYTLTCGGSSKSVTVNVIPNFQEF